MRFVDSRLVRQLKHLVPTHVVRFAREFRNAGFECFLVGGAVRDMVLNSKPVDFDFATNAVPDKTARLFHRVIPTGVKHGTVTVLYDRMSFEVTTYRTEGNYSNSRHPDSVAFVSSIEDDLSRRDFTMNAIAYDPVDGRLLDPYNGVADIRIATIRAIGEPRQRFQEDALRMLRVARFAAQLSFTVDPATIEAARVQAHRINLVSAERIRDELTKLLQSPVPSTGLRLILDMRMLEHILPELAEGIGVQQRDRHLFDVFEHSLRTCDAIAADRLDLRLAALLHDIGKPRSLEIQGDGDRTFHGHDKTSAEMADSILARLRFPNDVRKHVTTLVRHHMFDYTPESTDASVRRLLRRVGPENIDDLIALRQADRIAVRGDRDAGAAWASEMHQRIDTIANRDDALSVGDLTVNGDDLCAVGIPAGPRMGVVLDFLLESVLDDPTLNTRERLLEIAERYYRTRVDPH